MENTLRNKATFFAQYLDEIVEYFQVDNKIRKHKLVGVGFKYLQLNYPRKIKGRIGVELSFNSNDNHKTVGLHAKILLKPISSISDEDAKELSYYCGNIIDLESRIKENSGELVKQLINNYSKAHSLGFLPAKMVDKIRQFGYAIDWSDLTVEMQIEYGWVKLKK